MLQLFSSHKIPEKLTFLTSNSDKKKLLTNFSHLSLILQVYLTFCIPSPAQWKEQQAGDFEKFHGKKIPTLHMNCTSNGPFLRYQ